MGSLDIAVAGGVESMTMVPMTGNKLSARRRRRWSECPTVYTPMGITAENVANRFQVSRADQDAFALKSHQKAAAARAAGRFEDEIVTGARRCASRTASERDLRLPHRRADPRGDDGEGARGAEAGVLGEGQRHAGQQLAAVRTAPRRRS